MRAVLLTLKRRDNGHWHATFRTTTGSRQVHVIASGANVELQVARILHRLNKPRPRG
jgi:hypothetical protein